MQEFIRLIPPRALTLAALEAFARDLEVRLNNLAQQHARLEGRDGATPTFRGHVDLGGNRLKNVGTTVDQSDAPNRKELQTHAMYVKEGVHVAARPIHARRGLRVGVPAVSGDDVVPLRQLKDTVASLGSGSVTSIAAGNGITATPDPIVGTGTIAVSYAFADEEVPGGALPTATLTLAHAPVAGSLNLFLNGSRLKKVGAGPGTNEFTLSGTTITTWRAIDSTDYLVAYYRY